MRESYSYIGIVVFFILLVILSVKHSQKNTIEGLEDASDETVKNRQAKDQYVKDTVNSLDSIKNPTNETRRITAALKSGLASMHKISPKEKIEFTTQDLSQTYGKLYGDPNTKEVVIDSDTVNFNNPNATLKMNNKDVAKRRDDSIELGDGNTPVRNKKICFIDNAGNEECVDKTSIEALKRINLSNEYDSVKTAVNTYIKDQQTFDKKVKEVLFGNTQGYDKDQMVQDLQTLSKYGIDVSKITSLTNMVDNQGNLIGDGKIYLKEGNNGKSKEAISMDNNDTLNVGNGFSNVDIHQPVQYKDTLTAENGIKTNYITSRGDNPTQVQYEYSNDTFNIEGDKNVKFKAGNSQPLDISSDNKVNVDNQLCIGSQNDSVCLDSQTIQKIRSYFS
jgi:hypothetical protein